MKMLGWTISRLRLGKIEPSRGAAIVAALRFKLELLDRFETNRLIESYRDEIRRLGDHVMALIEERKAQRRLQ
jgi:hypothetical protein